jgi:hypothetical protein
MKNALLATVLLFLLVETVRAQQPYKVKTTRNKTYEYYRENICTVSPGSTIVVITPRVKGSKESQYEGGSGNGYTSGGYDERIEFGHRSDKSFEKEDEDEDDDSNESSSTEERTVTSAPPQKVSKITFTQESSDSGSKTTETKPGKPVLRSPPSVIDDCIQKMRLSKFYKDSTLTEYVLSGLEVRSGVKTDTFIVSDTVRGCTVRMNFTSLPRKYIAKGRTSEKGAKPTPFTEKLFSVGAGSVELQRYMIVVTKTKKYDPCKTKEVIQNMTWSSIKRAPNGNGSH